MSKTPKIYFASQDAPKLKMTIQVEEKYRKIEFKDGVYMPKDDEVEIIRELIETKPNISQLVRIIDVEQAEKLAKKHQEMRLRQNQAISGPTTSAALKKIEHGALAQRDAELAAQGLNPTMVQDALEREQQEKSLVLTTETKEVHRDSKEGFIPINEETGKAEPTAGERTTSPGLESGAEDTSGKELFKL